MLDMFVKSIQDQGILDTAADSAQPVFKRMFRGRSGLRRDLKNILSGTWIGHPLHPIVKDIPIGTWTTAALLDAAGVLSGDGSFGRAADVSIAAGLGGALVSAVTGLSDWSDTTGRARRIGVAHAVTNIGAAGLYAASLFARRRGDRGFGMQLSFAGYAVMILGAYLGGHLVFGEQIGVNHAARSDLPTDFIGVMRQSDLVEGRPARAYYKGVPVVLIRKGSQIHALYEQCSHMGGPLSKGSLEGDSLRCPWHGSRFSVEDGRVLEGPATVPQPCFETRILDGEIQVRSRASEFPL